MKGLRGLDFIEAEPSLESVSKSCQGANRLYFKNSEKFQRGMLRSRLGHFHFGRAGHEHSAPTRPKPSSHPRLRKQRPGSAPGTPAFQD